MGTEVFDSGDQPFFQWMQSNPDGFVTNTEKTEGSSLFMLHRSRCSHISSHGRGHSEDGFTLGDYMKVCAPTMADLHAWAQAHRPNANLSRCRSCSPTSS